MRLHGTPLSSFWSLVLLLPIGLMLLNVLVRVLNLFPGDISDESNWLRLLFLIQQGYEPPVSGPLFIWLIQEIHEHLPFVITSIISSVAILSSGVLYALVIAGYRGLLPRRDIIWGAALMLLMTSYFLAPAMEARPQQLGVALTFLACLYGTRNTARSAIWLPVVLTPLMFWHVLSFFVAMAYLALWMLVQWRLGYLRAQQRVHWLLCSGFLMFLLFQFQGYSALFEDVLSNHVVTPSALALSFMAAVLLILGLLAIPLSVWDRLKRLFLSTGFAPTAILLSLSLMPLVLQWSLLPTAAVQHYGSSGFTFLMWQAGNLAFLVCYVLGLQSCARHGDRELQMFVQGSLILGILAVAALIASYFLSHTNWMIRLLYYWVPFAAPVSALGFRQLFPTFEFARYVAFVCFVFASLSHTVRYAIV